MKEGSKGKSEGVDDRERREKGREGLKRDKDGARLIGGRITRTKEAREYLVKREDGRGVEG